MATTGEVSGVGTNCATMEVWTGLQTRRCLEHKARQPGHLCHIALRDLEEHMKSSLLHGRLAGPDVVTDTEPADAIELGPPPTTVGDVAPRSLIRELRRPRSAISTDVLLLSSLAFLSAASNALLSTASSSPRTAKADCNLVILVEAPNRTSSGLRRTRTVSDWTHVLRNTLTPTPPSHNWHLRHLWDRALALALSLWPLD